jgi:hypothetical protein
MRRDTRVGWWDCDEYVHSLPNTMEAEREVLGRYESAECTEIFINNPTK